MSGNDRQRNINQQGGLDKESYTQAQRTQVIIARSISQQFLS